MLLGLVTRDNPLERLRERLYLRVKSVIGHNQTTWISLQQKKNWNKSWSWPLPKYWFSIGLQVQASETYCNEELRF